MTRHLHVVRHAEADTGATMDPGLSSRGREQARALARRLQRMPITAIHHSAKQRATETAEILRAVLPEVAVLRSVHLQDRTPVPREGALASVPSHYCDWLAAVPVAERDIEGSAISAGIDHFTKCGSSSEPGTGDLVLETHAFVVASYARHALEAPAWRWPGLHAANASLTTLALTADRPMLVSFNDTGHLAGLI